MAFWKFETLRTWEKEQLPKWCPPPWLTPKTDIDLKKVG